MKLIITLVICSVIYFNFLDNEKPQEANFENRQNTAAVVKAFARSPLIDTVENTSKHENIEKTLRLVAEKWKRTDTNGDGLYNCIDAAVLFYQYYPDRSNVRIIVNQSQKTGMNHLFNCVFMDGTWETIEPQSFANNHANYLMRSVWGNRYDNSYDRDATSDYSRYAGNF